jgi:tetratricopeptide (TPR) repeat protein
MLAQAYLETDRPDEAGVRAARAAELAEAVGQPEAAAELRMLADMAGASAETHELARRMHEATIALDGGRHQEALESLEAALGLAKKGNNDVAEALASGLLARALAHLGRRDEARRHARRARQISASRGEAESVAHFDALLAEIEDN